MADARHSAVLQRYATRHLRLFQEVGCVLSLVVSGRQFWGHGSQTTASDLIMDPQHNLGGNLVAHLAHLVGSLAWRQSSYVAVSLSVPCLLLD